MGNNPSSQGEAKPAPESVVKEIKEVQDKAAENFKAEDSTAFAQGYTTDCSMMPPNAAIASGREGVSTVMGAMKDKGITTVKFTPIEVYMAGNLGTVRGSYIFLKENDEEADKGKYVAMFKKINNEWMVHFNIFNSDNA